MGNTIPNFDGMNPDELRAFWSKYHRGTRAQCAELIGDRRPGYTGLAADLANYAINTSTAHACRTRGDILAAQVYESIAERIYQRLPADLKW